MDNKENTMPNTIFTWGVDYWGVPTVEIDIYGLPTDPIVQANIQAQIQAAIDAAVGS